MDWLAFLGTLVSIAAAVAKYLGNKQLIDTGKAEAVAAHLQGALDEIRTANKVRDEVRADLAAHPDKLREPDVNSRT